MERQVQLTKRRERDRKRKEQIRQDQLMIAYIKIKHPTVYEEANQYYNTMNAIYINKKDLRKTARFKEVEADTTKRSSETVYHDNMILEIPLIQPATKKPEETDIATTETSEERMNPDTVDSIFPDIATAETSEERMNLEPVDSIFPDFATTETSEERMNPDTLDSIFPHIAAATLVQELPADLIQQIIDELRADPKLATIMDNIEDQVLYETEDLDIDIDIVDNLLEKELL